MIENLIAKDTGLSLITHSKAVGNMCYIMMDNILCDSDDKEKYKNISRCCGLLHDIGKTPIEIQDYLNGNETKCNEKKHFLHNEISWAFITSLKLDDSKFLLNAIYWHHAKYCNDDTTTYSQILNNISDDDKYNMIELFNHLMNDTKKICDINLEESNPTRNYFDDDRYNHKYIVFRSVLISADRIVSSLSNEDVGRVVTDSEFCLKLINNEKIMSHSIILPQHYDPIRFSLQEKIVNDCNDHKTILVKACAGFGKTLIGVLWFLKSKRKLLWVVPRNVIAESVFDSVVEELNVLGITNISVELFLTGERKMGHNVSDEDFSSDIIITNIDNFFNPFISDNVAKKSYFINYYDVIFDEYHEYFGSDGSLFSGFVEVMRTRNLLTNSKTLLLSATPSISNFLWDNENNKTCVLPNEKSHYDSTHKNIYNINIINESDIHNISDGLIVANSIKYAQELKTKKGTLIKKPFSNKQDWDNIFSILHRAIDVKCE
jgi:CRISPR-associated endonuclease Cas3-HD